MTQDLDLRLTRIRQASQKLRRSSITVRNQVLENLARLIGDRQDAILQANAADVAALSPDKGAAFNDRLKLNPQRIQQIQKSLRKVAVLPDPIGAVEETKRLENGLLLKRVRAPLGVILMIFEARPNVVTEAFSLALKSGNALIMRGGSESLETCKVLYGIVNDALGGAGLPGDVFWGVTDPDRALAQKLMTQHQHIDVLVPRGGDSLIAYVVDNATIPIIKNDRGLCHVYIHEDGDPEMAVAIADNAKTQRPGVCNSMETLLVHRKQKALIPRIYDRMQFANVQWFGCPETVHLLAGKPDVKPATDENFATEYLDFKVNCRVVNSLEDALAHIEKFGSRHSEAIITASAEAAREFQDSVDAAAVYWNASTRFTDGYEFGLGGELGISTQKLHVRGPVGLKELTSLRWIIDGSGQIRG
jgi:glutamate-5-semialdehyde dehydrogenase